MTQGTGAAQPPWSATGGPNGLPCLTFDGATKAMIGSTAPFNSNSFELLIILKSGNAAGSGFAYTCGDNSSGLSAGVGVVTGSKRELNWNGAATADDNTNNATTSWEKWTAGGNNTPGQGFRVNGAVHTLNNAAVATVAPTANQTVGARNNPSLNQFWNGSIAEIIAYNRLLALAETQLVEAYLLGRYGV